MTVIQNNLAKLPIIVAVIMIATAAQASYAKRPVPRFEKAECAVKVVLGERIECGFLYVPENRRKARSRTISLPVTIFRSTAAAPAADPVVYLPGGPGLSSIDGRTTGKGNPFLMERDLILLEGRGNKFARPSLACPDINILRAQNATPAAQTEAVAQCRAALVASGVDLDGYTSADAADDLDDLRRLLGIRQWNLIGFSYGTRLAQTVLQRHPEGVRSVVLDSALPIDVNYDETAASSLRRAIDAVLAGCANDPACDLRYPDLRARFAKLVADADRTGVAAPDRMLRGRDIVEAVGAGLQQPAIIPSLPRIIAVWTEFDLDKGIWTIPAARMKARETHVVPLSASAVALLRKRWQERTSDTGLVFAGRGDKAISDMTMTKLLRDDGITGVTVHGFRSAFTDWSSEKTRFPKEVADKALAHKLPNKVEAAYRRTDFFEKRRSLMARWSEYLDRMPGRESKDAAAPASAPIPLRAAA